MSTGLLHFVDQARVPSTVFTLDGFREWAHSDAFPETGHVSFLRGDIEIDSSPEELFNHNSVKSDLYVDFGTLVRDRKIGKTFVDGAFFVNDIGCCIARVRKRLAGRFSRRIFIQFLVACRKNKR